MLKKASSFVLASLRGSTYRKEYASPLHLLRPRWTTFLNILQGVLSAFWSFSALISRGAKIVFQQPARDRMGRTDTRCSPHGRVWDTLSRAGEQDTLARASRGIALVFPPDWFHDGHEGGGVKGVSHHHFLPSSVLNSRLPYGETKSVGAHVLYWASEYGPNKN